MTTDRDEVIKTMKSMDVYKSGYEKFPSELSLKAQKSAMNTIKQHQMKQKNIIR